MLEVNLTNAWAPSNKFYTQRSPSDFSQRANFHPWTQFSILTQPSSVAFSSRNQRWSLTQATILFTWTFSFRFNTVMDFNSDLSASELSRRWKDVKATLSLDNDWPLYFLRGQFITILLHGRLWLLCKFKHLTQIIITTTRPMRTDCNNSGQQTRPHYQSLWYQLNN